MALYQIWNFIYLTNEVYFGIDSEKNLVITDITDITDPMMNSLKISEKSIEEFLSIIDSYKQRMKETTDMACKIEISENEMIISNYNRSICNII